LRIELGLAKGATIGLVYIGGGVRQRFSTGLLFAAAAEGDAALSEAERMGADFYQALDRFAG
jgi:hypothetical protein